MAYEQDRLPGNQPYAGDPRLADPVHRTPPPGSGVAPIAGLIAVVAIVALVLFGLFGGSEDATAPATAPAAVDAPLAPEAGAPAADSMAPAADGIAPPAATDGAETAPAPVPEAAPAPAE
ncbi:hypothetical protein [Szabonella alba]|uniref:Uncharacterized protein n=1 Tax=Szabonella alba TaxID=2804194 RepID=A0A8K0VHC9_9RHOB|nr:hypothetical protein [Szabonella alba]MBL4919165.1 hypothetical protein [Szabonella alba]